MEKYTQTVTREGNDLILTITQGGRAIGSTRWKGAAKYLGFDSGGVSGKLVLRVPISATIETK